jgi:hypothetical protein
LSRYFYNTWRPVTAIQRKDIWLPSGHNISSPDWTPLLAPTPSHQDYVSTHSTIGGAAAAVIRAYNGGDSINATISSNVTLYNRGVITRTFTNLTETALQIAASRVFGGVSSKSGLSLHGLTISVDRFTFHFLGKLVLTLATRFPAPLSRRLIYTGRSFNSPLCVSGEYPFVSHYMTCWTEIGRIVVIQH